MAGAWPPSSMVMRFMCWPASMARCLPTGVEPVKVILRITGCGIRYSEIRSEEHTSELQSLMRISYAVFCLKKKTNTRTKDTHLKPSDKHLHNHYPLIVN